MNRKKEVINILKAHKRDLIENITPLFHEEKSEQGGIRFISSRNTIKKL